MSTDEEGKPQWIWKDGKGGYEELLRLWADEEKKLRQ
jgi:hypothetical protein